MAVVLVLGAKPNEQASRSGPSSNVTAAARPSELVCRAVMAMIGTRRRARLGSNRSTSSVSPLCESTKHDVVGMHAAQVAMHRFGRMQEDAARAGRGQRGRDLLPTMPALPMPVTMALPRQPSR